MKPHDPFKKAMIALFALTVFCEAVLITMMVWR